MKKQISVVIPTYNSVKTVVKTIESLFNQTLIPSEIIVINNASTDKTHEILERKFGRRIKLVTLQTNTGVTGGRNLGIKSTSKQSDYILFMDHDMTADKKMLERLISGLDIDNSIGIVTPKIYYLSDKKKIWAAGTGINLRTGQILFRGGKDTGQFNDPVEVEVAPATFVVKREVLRKIKKFDERYFATYEDTDFCFRAKKYGFRTFYVPGAIAHHDLPLNKDVESERLLKRLYWVGRNRVLFMKDFGKPFWWLFLPIFFLYYLWLSLKYGSINHYWRFIAGTLDGITYRK